jgi:hypothetical protein
VRNGSVLWSVVVVAAAGATLTAGDGQERPAPAVAPVAATSRSIGAEPGTGEARGWTRSDGTPLAGVIAHGPATRVTAATDLTLLRSEWSLTGPFAIGATFQRTAETIAAPYGLTLGSTGRATGGTAFLVRADGGWSVQRAGRAEGEWTAASVLRAATATGPAADRLEVRVVGRAAEFLVNGTSVTVVAIAPGELDGRPGVRVGAQGDVLVTTFTVEASPALFRK